MDIINVLIKIVMVTLLCGLLFFLYKYKKESGKKHILMVVLIALIVSGFIEGIGFQIGAFQTFSLETTELNIPTVISSEGWCVAEWQGLEIETKTVEIQLKGEYYGIVKAEASFTDNGSSNEYIKADHTLLIPYSDNYSCAKMWIMSHKSLDSLQIRWEQTKPATELIKVRLNVPIPYRFNLIRFLIIFLAIAFPGILFESGFWKKPLEKKSKNQKVIYCVVAMFCMVSCVFVYKLTIPRFFPQYSYTQADDIEYPFRKSIGGLREQTHAIMAAMLLEGQTIVPIEVDDQLNELQNPYDYSLRKDRKIDYLFDYVFYKGHYYVYFGLSPVILFYIPYYFLFGVFPSYLKACLAFALGTVIACFYCIWKISSKFGQKTSIASLCLCSAMCAIGSGIWLLQACARRYEVPVLCAQMFFFFTVGTAVSATQTSNRFLRSFRYFICAVCTFFLLWSRPSIAIAGAGWVIPLFIFVLLDRNYDMCFKMADALSFLLPLSLLTSLILFYNYTRFGSLSFGSEWQLTVQDVRYATLNPRLFWEAIYQYVFSGSIYSLDFPWIRMRQSTLHHIGNVFAFGTMFGILTVPTVYPIFFLFSDTIRKKRKQFFTLFSALLTVIFLIWFEYCTAGITMRYICDMLPSLCLISSIILMNWTSKDLVLVKCDNTQIMILLLYTTLIVMFSMTFSNDRNYILYTYPEHYLYFVNLFSF